jgi:hypothetical protein
MPAHVPDAGREGGRDWPIRQLDLPGRFGVFFPVKATLIVSTFLSQGDRRRVIGRWRSVPPFSTRE